MLSDPQLLFFDAPDFGQPASTHRIACWQWGDKNASRTIVCAHGLTRNGRDFDLLAQALSADYRVLCPDVSGRGKSAWLSNPAGYTYPAYVTDMMYLLRALNITQTDWIGTSMGGIIGMMLANASPGLINALVLNDIGTIVSAAGLRRIMSYAGTKTAYATRTEAETALRERCATFGIADEAQWKQLFSHSFIDNSDGSVSFACDPAIATNLPKKEDIADVDLWTLWGAVTKIPTLLIRGAESDILTRETALLMQARHPQFALHEIPNTGHAPALLDKNQIDFIKTWLKTNPLKNARQASFGEACACVLKYREKISRYARSFYERVCEPFS